MISDAPCIIPDTDENGEPIRGLNAEGLKMLCFRLSMITNTSMEFYFNMPYKDLLKFVDELSEQHRRISATRRRK